MKNNYINLKDLLKSTKIPFFVAFLILMLSASLNANAQKFKVTGSDAKLNQSSEIGLSGSTIGKFYYLFRIDETGEYHSVTFQVGQGDPIAYAPQKDAGTYVIYEFDEFKEMPFNFELYKPEDGILQIGQVKISTGKDK